MTPEDVENIKKALLPDLTQAVKDEIANSHQGLSDQIEGVKVQVTAVTAQVKPMAEVYNNVNAFGSVIGWFVKRILIPISVVLGILLTYSNLKK